MSERRYLLIRADADARIGTGHLMRCLALAQAWADAGGQVVFITACSNERLLQRLYDEGFAVHRLECPYPDAQDWQVTEHLLFEHPKTWLVLDGYHFDSEYQRQVKEAGYRLMVIDDMAHLPHYHADIVLNQNIHAEDLRYSCEPYTKLLLGTKCVLLRREFSKCRGWKREIPEVARKVLVTLGGSDPDNVTLKVIQALQQVEVDALEAVVVVGGNNPHYEELQSAVRNSGVPIRLERNVTNMPELMAWADMSVSSAGSTCWELTFMGLPSMILVLAENQERAAQMLVERKVFLSLGYAHNAKVQDIAQALTNLSLNCAMRQKLGQNGSFLVDGLGVHRVMEALFEGW